jgi:hypothetical protein
MSMKPRAKVQAPQVRAKTPAEAHTPQPAQTLMRRAVKKPGPSLKRRVTAQSALATTAGQPKAAVLAKLSVAELDAKRLQHAQQVAKSRLISRFGGIGSSAAPTVTPLAPTPNPHPTTKQAAAAPSVTISHVATPPKRPRTTADMLEKALQQATSHQQPPPKRRRLGAAKRITSISAAVLAVLVLAGFVALQNLPGLRLRMASDKAGFTASLPDYQPGGYHLSHLSYSPGVVALQFQTKSSSRAYNITEKTSSWDSNTLRDMFVASASPQYQTVQSGGRTLYFLSQQQVTWVNSGIWYQVQGNSSLDNQQLVQLATSM